MKLFDKIYDIHRGVVRAREICREKSSILEDKLKRDSIEFEKFSSDSCFKIFTIERNIVAKIEESDFGKLVIVFREPGGNNTKLFTLSIQEAHAVCNWLNKLFNKEEGEDE